MSIPEDSRPSLASADNLPPPAPLWTNRVNQWQELANGSVRKQTMREGIGMVPPDRAIVTIHLAVYFNDREFKAGKFDPSAPPLQTIISTTFTGNPHVDDSNITSPSPLVFKLGMAQILRGLDVCVASMRVGEKSRFIVMPSYAFGEQEREVDEGFFRGRKEKREVGEKKGDSEGEMEGKVGEGEQHADSNSVDVSTPSNALSPPPPLTASASTVRIPPSTSLLLIVDLISYDHIQKVTEDGKISKKILLHGKGPHRPNDGAKCEYRCRGGKKMKRKGEKEWVDTPPSVPSVRYDWETIRTLTICHDPRALPGVESSLRNMYEGERSIFFIMGEYADDRWSIQQNGKDNVKVETSREVEGEEDDISYMYEIEIEMVSFVKGSETWQLSVEGKIDYLVQWKAMGNLSFQIGDFNRAIYKYKKIIESFQYDEYLDPPSQQRVHSLKVQSFNNISICKMKQNKLIDAIKMLNEALQIDRAHIKSLYRRGNLYAKLKEWQRGEEDAVRAKEEWTKREEKESSNGGEEEVKEADKATSAQPTTLLPGEGESIGVTLREIDALLSLCHREIQTIEKNERNLFQGAFEKIQL